MDNVYVYLTGELPAGIHELVTPCADGFTVYIDEHLDDNHRLDAYNHALDHIRNGDFDSDNVRSVQEMESAAHGLQVMPECTQTPMPEQEGTKGSEQIKQTESDKPREHRKRRNQYSKQLKRLRETIKYLDELGYDFFAAAERSWLEP